MIVWIDCRRYSERCVCSQTICINFHHVLFATGLAFIKLLAFVLFLIPYIALKIMGKGTGQST